VPNFQKSRILPVVALACVMALVFGSVAQARVTRHKPKRPTITVLHSSWHVVAPSGVQSVAVSGQYVFIAVGPVGAPSDLLIDEQTGQRVNLTPPPGYYIAANVDGAPLGGSWVMATCDSYANCESSPTYQLYNIPAQTWTPLPLPDLSTAGGYAWGPFAFGDYWIEWTGGCGYHCGPPRWAFQNIQTGQVAGQGPVWQPGGTVIPDLNSPTLTQALCAPLTVPSGFPDPTTLQPLPGTLVLNGRFAVAQQWSADNSNLYTYLGRCGSTLHELLTPELSSTNNQFAITQDAVVWLGGENGPVHGMFLPSLRKFTIPIPPSAGLGPWGRYVFLTSRSLYVESGNGRVIATASPRAATR
jgi:hypothetical protein